MRIGCALGCLLALAALAAPAAGAEEPPAPAYGAAEWHTQLGMDRALGEQGARELLAQLQLPPGAAPSPAEPTGGGTYLATRRPIVRAGQSDAQGWFTVPGTTAQVIGYISAHEPPGGLPGLSPPAIEPSSFLDIRFADSAGEIAARQLGVFVAQLPQGGVGVLAHAQDLWMVPREQIPAGVRAVRVTVSSFGGSGRRKRTSPVLGAKRTAQLLLQVQALAVARPSFIIRSCPAPHGSVRLSFLARPRGRSLATVTITVGGCGGVSLIVEGNEQPALAGSSGPSPLATLERWLRFSIP
ncbi:MAG TPA: hypothetical protein VFW29_09650 [Solirubrobacteraceae bacterium]|nr:hypothetical protein [Solirubrobacteraceae bacterium]